MTHKEIYYHLVKEENAHSLGELFKKKGILRQFNARKLINRELSILHETAQIKDILDLIEKQPDYPETVHKYNMNNDDLSLQDLEKSIDFEISKLFYLEPRALSMDFANGLILIF